MNKAKLTLTILVLLMGVSQLMADPKVSSDCCKPTPVGGLTTLTSSIEFPAWAREEKLDGDVVLNFRVDRTGEVSDIE